MPTYEYDCDDCGTRFEELVGTFQHYPEPEVCKSCGSTNFHKIFSKPGMVKTLYEDNAWVESQLKNKRDLENDPLVRDGSKKMYVPKGFPSRFQPDFGKTLH